jgi:hypothetical protein
MTAPLSDPDQRRAAAQIAQHSPQWVVIWGTHTRLYWAFPRFHAPPGTIITAPGTAELTTRMQHTELATRAHAARRQISPEPPCQRLRTPDPGGADAGAGTGSSAHHQRPRRPARVASGRNGRPDCCTQHAS